MTSEAKDPSKKTVRRTLPGLLAFLFKESVRQKKWALLPLWVLLAAAGLILLISGSSFILPAIYVSGF